LKPALQRALSGFDQGKVLGLVLNDLGQHAKDGYCPYPYVRR
jgi:hypothetical protein